MVGSEAYSAITDGLSWALSIHDQYYAPPLIGGGIKRCFCLTSDVCMTSVCLTSVCLSIAYIGPNVENREA